LQPFDLLLVLQLIQLLLGLPELRLLRSGRVGFLLLELIELLLRLVELLVALEILDLLLAAQLLDLLFVAGFRLLLLDILDRVGRRAGDAACRPRAQSQTTENKPER